MSKRNQKFPKYSPHIFVLALLAGFLAFQYFQNSLPIRASASDNVSGFAWSENIGWISFNSTNCDKNGNGYIDTDAITPGCGGADNPSTPAVNYGVSINQSTGSFSGYAWSENIGSINFAPAGSYPGSPTYSACLDFPGQGQTCDGLGSNKIGGWARACSVFQTNCSGDLKPDEERGGWDGWIKLRGSNYGVTYTPQNGELAGWAWGSDVVGWISFNCSNQGVCGTSNYKVATTASQPPQVSSPGAVWFYCTDSLHPVLSWTYTDGTQASYQIQINKGSANFNNPTYDTGEISSSSQSYTTTQSFDWDQKYYWQIRAKNQQGTWSNWSSTGNFTTPKHAYPRPDFGYIPASPSVNETVRFTDASQAFGGATITAWSWTFQNGNPASSSSQNPSSKFTSSGAKQVSLGVRDSHNYDCGITSGADAAKKNINVSFPLPGWKEINPR